MVALRNLCVENWFEQKNTQTHPLIQRWWQRKPFISRCCCYFFLVSRTHPRVRWHVNRFDYNGHSNWFNCPFHSIIAFIWCSVFLLWFVAVKWEREIEKIGSFWSTSIGMPVVKQTKKPRTGLLGSDTVFIEKIIKNFVLKIFSALWLMKRTFHEMHDLGIEAINLHMVKASRD